MKKSLIVITLVIFTSCFSQRKTSATNEFTAMEEVLKSVTYYKKIKAKDFMYNVFIVNNKSGSAHFEGSDEVSSYVLIIKTEYGEEEKPVVYVLNDMIAPKFISLKDSQITIEHMREKRVKEVYQLE